MKYSILIPKDRINVLKSVKKEIERKVDVKIKISDNAVEVEGDGLNPYLAERIVKAIARGFSPKNAYKLFDEDVELEIIPIPAKDRVLKRIKSRLIGTRGKARRRIEEATGCCISIYGKTVSIIGNYEGLIKAKKAIEMLINGASHSKVYKFLERKS